MKRKWIALRRVWRKMERADRWFFKWMSGLVALNLAFVWMIHGQAIENIVWLLLFISAKVWEIQRVRRARYLYYLQGGVCYWERTRPKFLAVVEDLEATTLELLRLKQDYNKLKCDYHRLKKEKRQK